MSEDLTKKLPRTDSEKLSLILTIVQNLEMRVGRLELRLDNFEKRFDTLENKVDERLYDTRPIWQKVVADIAQLQEGQKRLEGDVREIKTSVRDISLQIGVMNDTMLAVQAKHRDLDIRVREFEQRQQKPSNSST